MKNKFDIEYLEERTESMLISKIAHFRLKVRDLMRGRHKADWPELHYTSLKSNISESAFTNGTNLKLFRGANATSLTTLDIISFICVDGTEWRELNRQDNS